MPHLLHQPCGSPWGAHGMLTNGERHVVCPGDWVVLDHEGVYRAVKPAITGEEKGVPEGTGDFTPYWECYDCRERHASTVEAVLNEGAVHASEHTHRVGFYGVYAGE
jgi:hypothetical protein